MDPGEFSQIRRRGQPFGFESQSQTSTTTYSAPQFETFDNSIIMPQSNSGRDRTMEFANTVRSLKGRTLGQQPMSNGSTSRAKNELLARQNREFMTIAASIGRDIASTYNKLEKLTILAKRRTLFDDRPAEIQELISIIKEDTNALNRQIDQLSRISKAQQQTLRSKHQATHSSTVVAALQLRLASMTSDFKQVLEVRSENLRESKSRRDQFSQGAVTKTLPQLTMNGFGGGSVLAQAIQDDESSKQGQVCLNIDTFKPLEVTDFNDFQVAINMGDENNAMMQMQQHGDMEYLNSRADAMQNIESTIVELGGIFQQLAHMIKEQEEIMVRIDSNVEDTAMNVEAGHSEILKYFQNVTSNRWLMIKIFGVLIFFFIFFVIFMA